MNTVITWDVVIDDGGRRLTRRFAGPELVNVLKVRATVEKGGFVFVSAESVNPVVTPDPEPQARRQAGTK